MNPEVGLLRPRPAVEVDGRRRHAPRDDRAVLAAVRAATEPAGSEVVLIATAPGLGIIRARVGRAVDDTTIRWVPWTRVRLASDDQPWVDERHHGLPPEFRLAVRVGRRTYHAALEGPAGKARLRDFVVAVQSGQERPRWGRERSAS